MTEDQKTRDAEITAWLTEKAALVPGFTEAVVTFCADVIGQADAREVTEDTVSWSVEILNKPSGKWAKMMGSSMHCDTEESASAYAYRLVDKCGVPSARVVQTRTVSTVEEVYPA